MGMSLRGAALMIAGALLVVLPCSAAARRGCILQWTVDGSFRGKAQDLRILPGGEAWAVGWFGRYTPAQLIAHRVNGLWTTRVGPRGELSSVGADTRTDVWVTGAALLRFD